MNKPLMYLLITVFGGVGSYLPIVLGADDLSIWSISGGLFGAIFGVYLAYKMSFD